MSLEEDILKAQQIEEEARKKKAQDMDNIRKRILNGESLGNQIKDYMFLHASGHYIGLEEELQQLQQDVAENQGKQALVLYTEFHRAGKEGCVMRLMDENEVHGTQLGIIVGELKLDLPKGNLVIPAQEHVRKGAANLHASEMPYLRDWEKQQGDIVIPKNQFLLKRHVERYNLNIFFGDEVELYFTSNSFELQSYLSLKRQTEDREGLLERQLHFRRRNGVDPEYVAALQVLGAEIPPNVKEKYDAQVLNKKVKIIQSIRDPESPTREVRNSLEQAVRINMHKEEQTIELEPGITMNVPEYIRAQCQKYSIKISE